MNALRTVAEGVNKFTGPEMGVLIITHYQRILHMVKPDFVHVMFEGRIVKEGGAELVEQLEEKGYGALLASKAAPSEKLSALMTKMKVLTAKPLTDFSHEWKFLPQQIVPIAPTKPASTAPPDMVKIPQGTFNFKVQGIEIEGSDDVGVDVGTPVIRIRGRAIFGPVITPAPKGEAAGRLWDGLVLVTEADGFFELKRTRDRKPSFE